MKSLWLGSLIASLFLVALLFAGCTDDSNDGTDPAAVVDTKPLEAMSKAVIDIPGTLSGSASVSARIAKAAETSDTVNDSAADFFEPVELYISVADSVAQEASGLIKMIIDISKDYPQILNTGTIPVNEEGITKIEVVNTNDQKWEYSFFANDENSVEKKALYLEFEWVNETLEQVKGSMLFNVDLLEPEDDTDGAYVKISFDTHSDLGAWMEVTYIYPGYTTDEPENPTKLVISVTDNDGYINISGGSYHPNIVDESLSDTEWVYAFRGVAENSEDLTDKALLEVGFIGATDADFSSSENVMSAHSLAHLWATIACNLLLADTETLTALGLDSSATCEDVFAALALIFIADPNQPDLLDLFAMLSITNPLYIDGEPVTTQGLIDAEFDTKPEGFTDLEAKLAGLDVVVPSEVKDLSLDAEITENGL